MTEPSDEITKRTKAPPHYMRKRCPLKRPETGFLQSVWRRLFNDLDLQAPAIHAAIEGATPISLNGNLFRVRSKTKTGAARIMDFRAILNIKLSKHLGQPIELVLMD